MGRGVFELMEWREDVAEDVQRLRARKTALFSWEPRLVAGVEVEDRGDILHVIALRALV